jgi:hypothetical protein
VTYFPALVPDAAPLAVQTTEDALALLPEQLKRSDEHPVTDALLEALVGILLEAQYRGSYAAAQSHAARATDRFLVELAADVGILASESEDDDALRGRVAAPQASATLEAIRAAVNAILAPHTARQCQVVEPALDRWFVRGSSEAVWFGGCVGAGISPPYGDRLYPSDATRNGGESLESSEPCGARTYSDRVGRIFQVLVPDLAGLTELEAFAWGTPRPQSAAPDPRTEGHSTFAGGIAAQIGFFARSSGTTTEALMRAIADTVDRLAGQSIRWTLLTDKNL